MHQWPLLRGNVNLEGSALCADPFGMIIWNPAPRSLRPRSRLTSSRSVAREGLQGDLRGAFCSEVSFRDAGVSRGADWTSWGGDARAKLLRSTAVVHFWRGGGG